MECDGRTRGVHSYTCPSSIKRPVCSVHEDIYLSESMRSCDVASFDAFSTVCSCRTDLSSSSGSSSIGDRRRLTVDGSMLNEQVAAEPEVVDEDFMTLYDTGSPLSHTFVSYSTFCIDFGVIFYFLHRCWRETFLFSSSARTHAHTQSHSHSHSHMRTQALSFSRANSPLVSFFFFFFFFFFTFSDRSSR